MDLSARYQREMARHREEREERERDLKAQEDALLRAMDPTKPATDPNEEAKADTLREVQRARPEPPVSEASKSDPLPSIASKYAVAKAKRRVPPGYQTRKARQGRKV